MLGRGSGCCLKPTMEMTTNKSANITVITVAVTCRPSSRIHKRARYPLNKEYHTLNQDIMMVRSLIKGYWALWLGPKV